MKILLLGKNGQVGWELQRALAPLGELHACGRQEADLEDIERVCEMVERLRPQVIVNASAYTMVDKAESESDKAQAINAHAVGRLGVQADRIDAWLIHYSTDYVFDGSKPAPYSESDPTGPLSTYGRTKLEGEQQLRAALARHMIFRTSWVFAARGNNFAKTMLRLARERDALSVVADQHGAPTSAELIADVTALALYRALHAIDGSQLAGTYHLAASGATSWHGYAQFVLSLASDKGINLKVQPEQVRPIATEDYPTPAARPRNSRLDTSRLEQTFLLHLPDWRHHVRRMIEELATRENP